EDPLAARRRAPIGNGLAGIALFYPTFSTFTGKPGLWLEDVFVRPQHRGLGLGRAFLEHFLALARKRGCTRAEWAVLHWNDQAVRFYQRLGAEVLPDWR
ncbi:MAG: GNAT family N-acetyltransferase, partial [Akkermansiaceae bacterium]|nr:GNAT family N-acetyltransferase [Akkermansiaceae bacterium]